MLDTPEKAGSDQTKPERTIDAPLLKRFAAIVGDKYAITDPQLPATAINCKGLARNSHRIDLRDGP